MKDLIARALEDSEIDASSLLRLAELGDESTYVFSVEGLATAYRVMGNLSRHDALQGWSPVILGEAHDLQTTEARLVDHTAASIGHIIERARSIDLSKWLRLRAAEFIIDNVASRFPSERWFAAMTPSDTSGPDLATALGSLDNREIFIAVVPCKQGWEIPAYLRFGGWEDCPRPEVHCAMLRRWCRRHSGVIQQVKSHEIDLSINTPPLDFPAVLQAYLEISLYCRVFQAWPMSEAERIASLMPLTIAKHWHFSWLDGGLPSLSSSIEPRLYGPSEVPTHRLN